MKKILVVSDNSRLVEYLMGEFNAQGLSDRSEIHLRYSKKNKNPSDLIRSGALEIDFSSDVDLEFAKSYFDVVFSLHCKQIFPATLVDSVACLNLHPGLNPYNRGWYPQVFSIINGFPAGATLHRMDHEIDHGPILDQVKIEISSSDTSFDVYEKIFSAEKQIIKNNLSRIVDCNFETFDMGQEGNYNSIQDFKNLCRLNLDSIGTLKDHIDLLRALTHSNFRNAYFLDENGRKVYVQIKLECE